MATTNVELVLIVDESGCYVASHDEDTAFEHAENDSLDAIRRVVRLSITVPLPEIIKVRGEITSDNATLVLSHA